nr:UBP1-associated protein 2C-like [Tanacetum cinerariifolium]
MTPAIPRGSHAGMYHGGHPDYKSEQGARRAVVDLGCKMTVDGKKGRSGGRMTSDRNQLEDLLDMTEERADFEEHRANTEETKANVEQMRANMKVVHVRWCFWNVPWEVGNERLLECFAAFGEIEEGPLGFEKKSRGAKGFAFFVYKSEEGARKAVVDSVKSIDGYQVMCKMAVDGKKGRAGGGMMPPRGPVPGIVNTAFHIAELLKGL